MKQTRILPLLGPLLVLYLIADVAASAGGLSRVGAAVALVAVMCATAPLFVRRREATSGSARVGLLGVSAGVALVGGIEPAVPSYAAAIAAAIASSVTGALVLDLAWSVPDAPGALRRARALRALSTLGAIAAGALSTVAILPPLGANDDAWLVPGWVEAAAVLAALLAAAVALVLRLARRAFGSGPDALAANAWAVLGLVPAVAAGAIAVGLVRLGDATITSSWVRGLAAVAAASLVYGHVVLIDPRRRLQAAGAARRTLAAVLSLAATSALAALLAPEVPEGPLAIGVAAAALLVAGVLSFRAIDPVVRRAIAPFGGRLLLGVDEAIASLDTATTVDDLARGVLAAMRRASGAIDAMPLLYSFDPPREARIDAAGEPHVRNGEMPSPIAERLRDRPGEVVVRMALEDLVVRRPELRPIVEALESLDAACAVPLTAGGEIEGALIVPLGRRRSALMLEEIDALERLGVAAGSRLSLLTSQARAQQRASEVRAAADRLEERIEQLEEELERMRADARVLGAGRGAGRLSAPLVAYSPAMRALGARITDVAPMDAPVLLVAEGGTPVDQIARRLHDASGRAGAPFVIADCASMRPEQSASALFGAGGDETHPGWLRLASGGTLLLSDIPALSLEAQRELAEALAARQARAIDGAGAYPVDVRIVATARLPIEPLVAADAFDAELARWLAPLRLDVPPLRERREDLPSLVLLAIDRACRVLGRSVVGIEQAALDALLAHDWPGNLRELQHVVERAVARSLGSQVRRADLPPLSAAAEPAAPAAPAIEPEIVSVTIDVDPFEGTWTELEERILRRALERAGGNKSEAARSLGLKRTTFLDKIRRFGLEGAASRPPAAPDASTTTSTSEDAA